MLETQFGLYAKTSNMTFSSLGGQLLVSSGQANNPSDSDCNSSPSPKPSTRGQSPYSDGQPVKLTGGSKSSFSVESLLKSDSDRRPHLTTCTSNMFDSHSGQSAFTPARHGYLFAGHNGFKSEPMDSLVPLGSPSSHSGVGGGGGHISASEFAAAAVARYQAQSQQNALCSLREWTESQARFNRTFGSLGSSILSRSSGGGGQLPSASGQGGGQSPPSDLKFSVQSILANGAKYVPSTSAHSAHHQSAQFGGAHKRGKYATIGFVVPHKPMKSRDQQLFA